ncbi:MAG: peptidoglycan DD-metalloendopeptidase family protein [Patescibacteria group bacterium]|nr:peptidoglycan DD-metalloendopeptidase family protein [Patescibacteria group bacterium]
MIKISIYQKILLFSLGLLSVNFCFVLGSDFSLRDDPASFLKTANQSSAEQLIADSDFIFPLSVPESIDTKDEVKNKNGTEEKQKPKKILSWKYTVKKNESLWIISRKFRVPMAEILALNNLNEKSIIRAGDKILIPGSAPQARVSLVSELKKLTGKFVIAQAELDEEGFSVPVSGINWGIRHGQNGSDIAANCGEPVYASKEGKVIESLDGWNGGYGNYIIIDHGRGIYTLYGHLSLRVVEIGDEVEKGELIGYVGNTGYTEGPTGCHLHFEVRGKINPLLK